MGRPASRSLTRKVSVAIRLDIDTRDKIEKLARGGEWDSVSAGCAALCELGLIVIDNRDKMKAGAANASKLVTTLADACETGEILDWANSVPQAQIENVIEALHVANTAKMRQYKLDDGVASTGPMMFKLREFNADLEKMQKRQESK